MGKKLLLTVLVFFIGKIASGENFSLLTDTVFEVDSIALSKEMQLEKETFLKDSIFETYPWYKQLIENGFRIHDPRVNYPAFPKFCLKIYDWGDKTFNTYDPKYVVGVGKNWKVVLKSYNWLTSYMMRFDNGKSLHIRSDLYPDFGAYVCFMAVNVGYTAKMDNLFGHKRKTRENFNVSFTTSRFHALFNHWKTRGDAKITKFGNYDKNHNLQLPFDNINMGCYSVELFYFFNNKKYSHAAAYCFSKYQLKSAGSCMAGFTFNHQTLDIDFSGLSHEIKDHIPDLQDNYRFRFNDYNLAIGYGYNFVLKPRTWLINIMLLPSIGYRYSYKDSSEGQRNLFAFDLYGSSSVVYNHRSLYASLALMLNGHLYFNNKYTFFDSINSLSLNMGVRF